MRFLVDENLSRVLVTHLHGLGHEAERVSDVGLRGQLDHVVWEEAFRRGAIFVTANVEDFLELAGTSDVHPGLIVFRAGDLTRDEQCRWLRAALERLEKREGDLVNAVIEVRDGETDLTVDDYELAQR